MYMNYKTLYVCIGLDWRIVLERSTFGWHVIN